MVVLSRFLRGFGKWQSEAQEKGMRALQLELNKIGRLDDQTSIWAAFAVMIQKDHESQKWLVDLMGDHVKKLQDEIKNLAPTSQIEALEVLDKSSGDILARLEKSEKTIESLKEQVAKLKKTVAKLNE